MAKIKTSILNFLKNNKKDTKHYKINIKDTRLNTRLNKPWVGHRTQPMAQWAPLYPASYSISDNTNQIKGQSYIFKTFYTLTQEVVSTFSQY